MNVKKVRSVPTSRIATSARALALTIVGASGCGGLAIDPVVLDDGGTSGSARPSIPHVPTVPGGSASGSAPSGGVAGDAGAARVDGSTGTPRTPEEGGPTVTSTNCPVAGRTPFAVGDVVLCGLPPDIAVVAATDDVVVVTDRRIESRGVTFGLRKIALADGATRSFPPVRYDGFDYAMLGGPFDTEIYLPTNRTHFMIGRNQTGMELLQPIAAGSPMDFRDVIDIGRVVRGGRRHGIVTSDSRWVLATTTMEAPNDWTPLPTGTARFGESDFVVGVGGGVVYLAVDENVDSEAPFTRRTTLARVPRDGGAVVKLHVATRTAPVRSGSFGGAAVDDDGTVYFAGTDGVVAWTADGVEGRTIGRVIPSAFPESIRVSGSDVFWIERRPSAPDVPVIVHATTRGSTTDEWEFGSHATAPVASDGYVYSTVRLARGFDGEEGAVVRKARR